MRLPLLRSQRDKDLEEELIAELKINERGVEKRIPFSEFERIIARYPIDEYFSNIVKVNAFLAGKHRHPLFKHENAIVCSHTPNLYTCVYGTYYIGLNLGNARMVSFDKVIGLDRETITSVDHFKAMMYCKTKVSEEWFNEIKNTGRQLKFDLFGTKRLDEYNGRIFL